MRVRDLLHFNFFKYQSFLSPSSFISVAKDWVVITMRMRFEIVRMT